MNPWLHRYSVLLAVCTLALVVTGAVVTSTAVPILFRQIHLAVAGAVGLLTIGLTVWLWLGKTPSWLRAFGWILLGGVVVQAGLGGRNPAVAVVHAILAHLFFSATVAAAVFTSPAWNRDPQLVDDRARPPLRWLAAATLVLVIAQLMLGAAVRHKVVGVMPHIIGALIVTLVVLLLSVLVTNQYPEHRSLRLAAKALMFITFLQVMLGMGAFITKLMMAENTLPVVLPSVTHVMTGSLTLAATVVLTLQIRRHVRGTAAQTAASPSTVTS